VHIDNESTFVASIPLPHVPPDSTIPLVVTQLVNDNESATGNDVQRDAAVTAEGRTKTQQRH
jgi:hypothetical protein